MFLFRAIKSFFQEKIYRELLVLIIAILIGGTIFFHYSEGWNWLDSFYFCVSTVTTTGYGDLYPKSTPGKIFNIFYLIISLILILMFINTMNQHYLNRKEILDEKAARHQKMVKKSLGKDGEN